MNNRLNEYRHLSLVISSHFLEILVSVLEIYLHVDVWQKPTQYCKAIILQLKINLKDLLVLQYSAISFWQLLQFSLLFSSVALRSVFSVKLFIFHLLCLIFGVFSGGLYILKKKKKTILKAFSLHILLLHFPSSLLLNFQLDTCWSI